MIRTAALLLSLATPALAQTLDGVQRDFYDDGTLAGEITRSGGELDGPWRSYYPSGNYARMRSTRQAASTGSSGSFTKTVSMRPKFIGRSESATETSATMTVPAT
ncbi:hypothetical protein [Fulvimarina sp. MAC8]|uniref:hypothetical protein n=1 Tax=Fulvimarina sp. MAC8 TaxID=3162874 RepID=UPI0032EFB96D